MNYINDLVQASVGCSEARVDHAKATRESALDKERHLEAEDQALRLMDSTKSIKLGRNLEALKDGPATKKKKSEGREGREGVGRESQEQKGEDMANEGIQEIFEDDEVYLPDKEKKEKKKKKEKKALFPSF